MNDEVRRLLRSKKTTIINAIEKREQKEVEKQKKKEEKEKDYQEKIAKLVAAATQNTNAGNLIILNEILNNYMSKEKFYKVSSQIVYSVSETPISFPLSSVKNSKDMVGSGFKNYYYTNPIEGITYEELKTIVRKYNHESQGNKIRFVAIDKENRFSYVPIIINNTLWDKLGIKLDFIEKSGNYGDLYAYTGKIKLRNILKKSLNDELDIDNQDIMNLLKMNALLLKKNMQDLNSYAARCDKNAKLIYLEIYKEMMTKYYKEATISLTNKLEVKKEFLSSHYNLEKTLNKREYNAWIKYMNLVYDADVYYFKHLKEGKVSYIPVLNEELERLLKGEFAFDFDSNTLTVRVSSKRFEDIICKEAGIKRKK